MKYIVTELDGQEVILTFPRTVDHDRFAEGMQVIRFGDQRHWERKFVHSKIISAGFVTNARCHGHSQTLNISSRPGPDTALLHKDMGIFQPQP